jgi:hypothetical protein
MCPLSLAGKAMFLINAEEGNVPYSKYASKNFIVEFVRTARKQDICVMHIRYPGSENVILFSHGNATDLGCMRDHLIDMAIQLKARRRGPHRASPFPAAPPTVCAPSLPCTPRTPA